MDNSPMASLTKFVSTRVLSASEIETLFQKGLDYSLRLLAKVPKGITQFIVTLSWQGGGSIDIAIESPSKTSTVDMLSVYQKTVYSTSGGISDMLNIKRVAVSVIALSSDEDWYVMLESDDVEGYRTTVKFKDKFLNSLLNICKTLFHGAVE